MCWVGSIHDKRIAKRDITVYKILRKCGIKRIEYNAPFRDTTKYKIGCGYNVPYLGVRNYGCGDIEINEGLHCYSLNVYIKFSRDCDLITYSSDGIRSGLQRYYHYESRNTYKYVIAKCIIPKGSTYFINNAGEIVTEALHIIEDIGVPTNTSPLRFREIEKNCLLK